jgi:hypothetical protein
MTQDEYSAKSKGTYSHFETVNVCEHGSRPKRQYGQDIDEIPVAFKIRKTYGGTGLSSSADRVILITDKPQKPLPLDWEAIAAGTVTAKPEETTTQDEFGTYTHTATGTIHHGARAV